MFPLRNRMRFLAFAPHFEDLLSRVEAVRVLEARIKRLEDAEARLDALEAK